MLLSLSLLLLVVYLLGIFLTLILFKFHFQSFLNSELFKKILMWIPITIVFFFFATANHEIMLLGFSLLLFGIYYEQIKITKQKHLFILFFFISLIPITIAFLHLPLLVSMQKDAAEILLILAVSASLSDVGAFFFGKFFGRHKLPKTINNNKAWEGVLGQIVGAFCGIVLLKLFVFPEITLLLFLPIGIGSAVGDMYNSFLKRRINRENWSNVLPGHGGFTDRFSSLAGSSLLTYYFLLLIK